MIKTLIFDLGGVIIPFDFRRGYAAMAPHCGYPASEIPERLRKTDLVVRYETGRIASEPFVEELCELLDLKVSFEQFRDLWTCIFLPHTLVPDEMLAAFKGRYRLLALSNTNALHFDTIEKKYPILRHFDHMVLSYRVGAVKPQPDIYREALAHARCRPEESLFIDDIQAYVDAAAKEGIDAVRFQSHEQLVADLRARGVV